jgi:hypothetical protein
VRSLLGDRREQATLLQARIRGAIARARLRRSHGAAELVQAWHRGWRVRRQFGGLLRKLAAARTARARQLKGFWSSTAMLKPRMRQLLSRHRGRKQQLHREIAHAVTMRRFRRVARTALQWSRGRQPQPQPQPPQPPQPAAAAVTTEQQREHDAEQLSEMLAHRSGGRVSLHCADDDAAVSGGGGGGDGTSVSGSSSPSKAAGWTLKWGKLVLSKAKVAELVAVRRSPPQQRRLCL